MALAEMGHRVIAVDLDFGGANLHTFLGLSNRHPGIGDFLKARTAELDELLVPCQTPKLHFLPGDGKTPLMANIAYAQKVKLLSRIKRLEADFVILDLGAGSSFNTLDYFGVTDWGLVVITPEYPSVMGMLVFLKNYLFRSIKRRLAGNHHVQNVLRETFNRAIEDQVPSITELQRVVAEADPEADRQALKVYKQCRPRVIFNRGKRPEDARVADQISQSLGKILQVDADFFGFVFEDGAIDAAIRRRGPLVHLYPESTAARNIQRIAERIVKYWDRRIPKSAELIYAHAKESFEKK